jgi:hypothetical protein
MTLARPLQRLLVIGRQAAQTIRRHLEATTRPARTALVTGTLLRRGSFPTVADLIARGLAFSAYYNRTMAQPFTWTSQGKPLCD